MRLQRYLVSFFLIIFTTSCVTLKIIPPDYFLDKADKTKEEYEKGVTDVESATEKINHIHDAQIDIWRRKAEEVKRSRKRQLGLFWTLSVLNAGIGLTIPQDWTSKDYDDIASLYLGLSSMILSTQKPSIRADTLEKFRLELTSEIRKRHAEWMELYEVTEENLMKKIKKYKEDEEAYMAIAEKYYIPVSKK